MSIIPHDGAWYYRSTHGGKLTLTATESLLGLRVIAIGSSGNFTITPPSTAEGIPVTTQMPFDWTPSARVTASTLTFSSTTLQWFAEIGSRKG